MLARVFFGMLMIIMEFFREELYSTVSVNLLVWPFALGTVCAKLFLKTVTWSHTHRTNTRPLLNTKTLV